MSSADHDTSLLLNAFPLLYDDGTPIPPEAEGSVRMALGLTEEVLLRFASDADEQPKRRGAGEGDGQADHGAEEEEGEESGVPEGFIAELVPYAEADPLAEERRLKALAWLHIHSISSSSSGAVPPTLASPQQSAETCANNKGKKADVMEAAEKITAAEEDVNGDASDVTDESVEADACDEGGGGMGDWAFSREATAEDEPWVLDRILRRRVFRLPLTRSGEEEVDERKSAKTNPAPRAKELQYLCQWRHYAEPTWESRELLEEEGFKNACDAYDAEREKLSSGGKKPKRSGGGDDGAHCPRRRLDIDIYCWLEHVFRTPGAPPNDAEELTVLIKEKMCEGGLTPLYFMPVALRRHVAAFHQTWKRLSATHYPVLVFHGTNSSYVTSIVERGLVVPSSNSNAKGKAADGLAAIRVVNGSRLGIGIYTSTTPVVSASFCNTDRPPYHYGYSGEMFACLGLVSASDENVLMGDRQRHPNTIVFFDASYVIPVGLVGWRRAYFYRDDITPDWRNPSPLPRIDFCRHFSPTRMPSDVLVASHSRAQQCNENAKGKAAIDEEVPPEFRGRPMTKRMLQKAPRRLKEFYKSGGLVAKKGGSSR